MEKSSDEEPIAVGPWGGPRGPKWDVKGATSVRKIIIVHGGAIDSLVIKTDSKNGKDKWSPKIGGSGGDRTDKVEMDWPDEFLKSIKGWYGEFNGQKVVRALTFISNRSKYGPYGQRDGTRFSLPISHGMIVGFHGRASKYVDAIGIYLRPLSCGAIGCELSSITDDSLSMASLRINHESTLSLPSLLGGIGGRPWDDGHYTGIRSIFLQRENSAVRSIMIDYDRSGSPVLSPKYGSSGLIRDIINLDYRNEFLSSIEGFHASVEDSGGYEVIRSLTFCTNKRKYGPFGEEIGKFFTSARGKVVGFFGKSGVYLDSIGVHME